VIQVRNYPNLNVRAVVFAHDDRPFMSRLLGDMSDTGAMKTVECRVQSFRSPVRFALVDDTMPVGLRGRELQRVLITGWTWIRWRACFDPLGRVVYIDGPHWMTAAEMGSPCRLDNVTVPVEKFMPRGLIGWHAEMPWPAWLGVALVMERDLGARP
jgi:hypothetical protein